MGIAIYLVMMVYVSVLALWKPKYVVLVCIMMFGIEQWGAIYLPFVRNNGTFVNLYFIAICTLAILRLVVFAPKSILLGSCYIRLGLIIFISYAAFTLLWTPGLLFAKIWWPSTLAYQALVIFVVPLGIRTSTDLVDALQLSALLAGLLLLCFSIFPDWGNRELVIENEMYAESGSSVRLPLALSYLAGVATITSVLFIEKKPISIFMVAIIVGCSIYVAYKTQTRGQLVAIPIALILGFLLLKSRMTMPKFYLLLLTVTLVFASVATAYFETEGFGTNRARWQADKIAADAEVRLSFVQQLAEYTFQKPQRILFGSGNMSSFGVSGHKSHMLIAEIFLEQGIIGLSIFLALLYRTFDLIFFTNRDQKLSEEIRKCNAVNFAILMYILLISMKDGSWTATMNLFLSLSLIEVFCNKVRKESFNRTQRYL